MPIQIREGSIAMHILFGLDLAEDVAGTMFAASVYEWKRMAMHGQYKSYKTTVHRLMEAGLIQVIEKDEKKFLSLTKQGSLQVLMAKSRISRPEKWDGKWRIIFFDIPEENKVERQQLRRLLLKNGFKKMQASVYICPWPLNREAIRYLKEMGFIQFIRFGRLDELDEDGGLKKKFNILK